jgi:exosortase A-associated hydrolase 1
MQPDELALAFRCEDDTLYGVLSAPATPAARGVLIVVGGPQYRAGSHRQFTLLARALARQGIPAMRFDYRGMGDSSGAPRNFEAVQADLRAAVDQFYAASPGLQEVVLWGLCDAASASLFYARHDPRVRGLVLLNPWGAHRARGSQGDAEALLPPAPAGARAVAQAAARPFRLPRRLAVAPARAGRRAPQARQRRR